MTIKTKIIILVVVFASGIAIGKFGLPAKVIEKTKVVYQDKIVEKKVYVKDTTKKSDKVYTRTETDNKDGSKTIVTKVEDKTVTDTDIKKDNTENKTVSEEKDKEKTITNDKGSLIISIQGKAGINSSPAYGGQISKRIVGPFWMNASGYSDATFGAGVGIGF